MEKKCLYQYIKEYGQSDHVAFHMPGHKRQERLCTVAGERLDLPWQLDITEIDGFDNLHHAEGILKESMDMATSFYGTKHTFYSINGSTAGILSALFAVTKPGDTILMARNSHKSVYHGVFLRDLIPLYVYPQMDRDTGISCGYSPEDIETMLISHPEIKAVIITSPTYEGVISDIVAIANLVHKHGIPLIVDEAHGAHLTMKGSRYQGFPASATTLGADLVIQSLHKTLPALTQTAVLHVCKTSLHRECVYGKEAAHYMSMFQTSSPSYVLMASIDGCIRYYMSESGQQDQKDYLDQLSALRNQLGKYEHIHLLTPGVKGQLLDPSKILLQAEGMTGKELYDHFRIEAHLQPEMCTDFYVLLMTSVFDTEEMYQRLILACGELEKKLEYSLQQNQKSSETSIRKNESCQNEYCEFRQKGKKEVSCHILPHPGREYTPAQTKWLATEDIPLNEAAGRISAEYAYQYPPGIPLLVPGERIEGEILHRLIHQANLGIRIQGMESMDATRIRVVIE